MVMFVGGGLLGAVIFIIILVCCFKRQTMNLLGYIGMVVLVTAVFSAIGCIVSGLVRGCTDELDDIKNEKMEKQIMEYEKESAHVMDSIIKSIPHYDYLETIAQENHTTLYPGAETVCKWQDSTTYTVRIALKTFSDKPASTPQVRFMFAQILLRNQEPTIQYLRISKSFDGSGDCFVNKSYFPH